MIKFILKTKILPIISAFVVYILIMSNNLIGVSPVKVWGTSETPFGGRLVASYGSETCTCKGNSHWIYDYVSGETIKLYESSSSVIFAEFNTSATYQLGTHTGSASDHCWITVEGEDCEILFYNDYDYGSQPGTGTSKS